MNQWENLLVYFENIAAPMVFLVYLERGAECDKINVLSTDLKLNFATCWTVTFLVSINDVFEAKLCAADN